MNLQYMHDAVTTMFALWSINKMCLAIYPKKTKKQNESSPSRKTVLLKPIKKHNNNAWS